MSTRKGGLGRGLDTLIPTSITSPTGIQIADRNEVDINSIVPNPKQPRTIFDADALAELSASIKEVGLLQPPVVRDMGNGTYELIMGERRLRASKLAGLKTIPVIIRQTPDNELLREALLENIHRSQLNPLEEGSAYQNLLNDFGYTHEELASKVGKSRSAITNTLRLLTLDDESEIEKLANRINAEGLSVRATEEIVATSQNTTAGNNSNKPSSGKGANSSALTARLKEVADEMGSTLDTRVTVELGKQKGKITIEFATLEDLERIAGLI